MTSPPPISLEDEQALIEQAKTDAEALGALYDLHYAKIFNYILRRTGDIVVAQDITTETFMNMLDKIGRFTWRGVPLSAWLYRIAANEIASHYRSKHNKHLSLDAMMEKNGFEPLDDSNIEQSLIEAQEALDRRRQYRAVQKLILELPMKYQEVLALRYFEKKSIGAISQITGKRPGTVKSLLSRAAAKLRKAYEAPEKSKMQLKPDERVMRTRQSHE